MKLRCSFGILADIQIKTSCSWFLTTSAIFSLFILTLLPAVVLSEQVEGFSHDGMSLLRHSHVHAGTFWGWSRCLTLGQPSPAELWTAGESQRKQVPPAPTGASRIADGIGYTNRCLSEWNPYWLTRLIDSAAPATNCRLPLPPSVCNGDSGFRITRWPPAYQI